MQAAARDVPAAIISYSSSQRFVEQQFLVVEDPFLVFKVFPLDRVQQRCLPRKRISEWIVEQIVDPVSSGGLHGSLSGHGSSSSHSPAGVEERADEPGKGVLRTSRSSPRVPASGSPSTPAAQLEVAPLPDSVEWVRLRERHAGKTYFWNRRN